MKLVPFVRPYPLKSCRILHHFLPFCPAPDCSGLMLTEVRDAVRTGKGMAIPLFPLDPFH